MRVKKVKDLVIKMQILVFTFSILACFCNGTMKRSHPNLDRISGTVSGRVIDSTTRQPIKDVHIYIQNRLGITGTEGRFEIDKLNPGNTEIVTEKEKYLIYKDHCEIKEGQKTELNIVMQKNTQTSYSETCCTLGGSWMVKLIMGKFLGKEVVNGTIVFGPEFKGNLKSDINSKKEFAEEYGVFDIDLSPLIGEEYNNIPFQGADFKKRMQEVKGYIYEGNKVYIEIVPRIADFGLNLHGEIVGDTIKGNWENESLVRSPGGTFEMIREK